MTDTVIRVENLSKLYHIGAAQERHDSLRDAAASLFRRRPSPLAPRTPDTDLWALKDVSFEVKQGEVVGIIGRNGAGKSTLLKILSRITEPTSGRVTLHGRVASLLEVGTGFHPELTGRENIYLNGAILGMKQREIDLKFDEIVAFSEIERFLDTPVKRYSSGMYVRLAFSIAAHLDPEILLVDEVLAVGDTAFQRKCLGKMDEVALGGRTVILVSHNMAVIQNLCTDCCLLDSGNLTLKGPPAVAIQSYLIDGESIQHQLLEEREDRQGTGRLRFHKVSFQSFDGASLDSAMCGQGVQIAVSYQSESIDDVLALDIHVTFYTPAEQFLFTCSNEASGFVLDRAPSSGTLICRIPRLPLAPGRYTYNLYATVGGVIADWVQHAGHLDVVEGDYFGSGQIKSHSNGFLVDHFWSMNSQ